MPETDGEEPGCDVGGSDARRVEARQRIDAVERLVVQSSRLASAFRAEYLQRLRSIRRQLDAGPSDAAVEVVHATFTEALRIFTRVLTRDGGDSAH